MRAGHLTYCFYWFEFLPVLLRTERPAGLRSIRGEQREPTDGRPISPGPCSENLVSNPIVGKELSVPQISRRLVVAAFDCLQNDPVTSQVVLVTYEQPVACQVGDRLETTLSPPEAYRTKVQ